MVAAAYNPMPTRRLRRDAQFGNRVALTIGMLKGQGLFHAGHDSIIGFRVKSFEFLVQYYEDRERISIEFCFGDDRIRQEVYTVRKQLRYGERVYFACPILGRACAILVFGTSGFASAEVSGLPVRSSPMQRERNALIKKLDRLDGADGRGPARGRNRERIVEGIERTAKMRLSGARVADRLDAEHERIERGRRGHCRATSRDRAVMTVAGLEGSKPVSSEPRFIDRGGSDFALLASRSKVLNRAYVEDFPRLNIDQLRAFGMLKPGASVARTIEWPGHDNIIVDCRLEDPAYPFIDVRSRYYMQRWHIIRLEQNGQGRWYMLCPFTGKRCTVLFLRDGFFGSPAANCLIHRSQRKSAVSVAGAAVPRKL